MHNQLERITATKRIEVAAAKKQFPLHELIQRITQVDTPRAFADAVSQTQSGINAIIAEIKQASPSKGLLTEHFQPADIASAYQAGGARCLSVLTDRTYFRGDQRDLQVAKNACNLPTLRKDFIVDEYQIYQSRDMNADAVLLIASILDNTQLADYQDCAHELGMAVIVEVHNQIETERALYIGAQLIGINNRNLTTFTTDIANSERLAPIAHQNGAVVIAESGLRCKTDLSRLNEVGIHTFLIGESLIAQMDRQQAVAELL